MTVCWGRRPPGPGVVGPFFLGGFQDCEDGAEGLWSRELGAQSAVAGEGAQEAFELAHAQGQVADGVTGLSMILENDDGVGLTDSNETRVLLPWNLVAVSVGLSQLDAALADDDPTPHEAEALKDL